MKHKGILSLFLVLGATGCSSTKHRTACAGAEPEIQVASPQMDPAAVESGRLLVTIAKAQYEQGRLDASERALEQALQADPRNNEAWYYLNRVRKGLLPQDWEERDRHYF